MNSTGQVNAANVGRIAERIVANELEYHGYRVQDLNRQGLAANADLLAVRGSDTWQVQVKGSTNTESDKWWVGYGICSQEQIDNKVPVFNRHSSFYRADIVVLVAVLSLKEYRCIVLPVKSAEEAAQINLDGYFRLPKKDGSPHKPGKMYANLEPALREHLSDKQKFRQEERAILLRCENAWELPLSWKSGAAAASGSRT